MSVVIVTGSAGLIGSESAIYFGQLGLEVVGLDNDMRKTFFGESASTDWNRKRLEKILLDRYKHHDVDIRDRDAVDKIFSHYGKNISLIIHTAAQPSHDWAARDPITDFTVNANGTINLLEATRQHCPEAVFIFTSTNKVYGDAPNYLPLEELSTRFEIQAGHPYENGISENMSVDQCLHSLFGVSKLAADVCVQEYGRYFGMNTACFRGGCLTGPMHSGAELHGFLAYLMKATACQIPYTVFGYRGKQVRDNIHSADFVRALHEYFKAPRPGEVYNMGGGRASNCSMLEAIDIGQKIVGRQLNWTYSNQNRAGDHIWWISDTSKFESHYPNWRITKAIPEILGEIYEFNRDRWSAAPAMPQISAPVASVT